MPQSEFESLGSTLLVHVELPQAQSQEDLKELQKQVDYIKKLKGKK